jgi:hypothetical protein
MTPDRFSAMGQQTVDIEVIRVSLPAGFIHFFNCREHQMVSIV